MDDAAIGEVVITGEVRIGKRIRIDSNIHIVDDDGEVQSLEYQWQISGNNIVFVDQPGQTNDFYDIGDDSNLINSYIRVQVITTDSRGGSTTILSQSFLIQNKAFVEQTFTYNLEEDSNIEINISQLYNDSYPVRSYSLNSDTISQTVDVINGSTNISETNDNIFLNYIPFINFNGSDMIQLKVNNLDIINIQFIITNVKDNFVVRNFTFEMNEDSTYYLDLNNVIEENFDNIDLSYQIKQNTGPLNGDATIIDSNKELVYTSSKDFFGQDGLTLYVYDSNDFINTNAKEVVNIYVSSGNLESEPYYTFYTNIEGTSELTPINSLSLDKKYIFSRLNDANSHPFYISDVGYNTESTSSILLSGDGSYNSGITGNMNLSLEFNEFSTNNNLYFYCTSHSNMLGEFALLSSSEIQINSDYDTNLISEAVVIININQIYDDEFSVINKSIVVDEDVPYIILANDLVINPERHNLQFAKHSVLHGDIIIDETLQQIEYTPNSNYSGFDTIIIDVSHGEIIKQITISVQINQILDEFELKESHVYVFDSVSENIYRGNLLELFMSNFDITYGYDNFTYTILSSNDTFGNISIDTNGSNTFVYTITDSNFIAGSHTIISELEVSNGFYTHRSNIIVDIVILSSNKLELSLDEDSSITYNLEGVYVIEMNSIQNGIVSIDTNNTLSYRPLQNYSGKDHIILKDTNNEFLSITFIIHALIVKSAFTVGSLDVNLQHGDNGTLNLMEVVTIKDFNNTDTNLISFEVTNIDSNLIFTSDNILSFTTSSDTNNIYIKSYTVNMIYNNSVFFDTLTVNFIINGIVVINQTDYLTSSESIEIDLNESIVDYINTRQLDFQYIEDSNIKGSVILNDDVLIYSKDTNQLDENPLLLTIEVTDTITTKRFVIGIIFETETVETSTNNSFNMTINL